jgi:hypothetical protein
LKVTDENYQDLDPDLLVKRYGSTDPYLYYNVTDLQDCDQGLICSVFHLTPGLKKILPESSVMILIGLVVGVFFFLANIKVINNSLVAYNFL